jgi:hypothetical protein
VNAREGEHDEDGGDKIRGVDALADSEDEAKGAELEADDSDHDDKPQRGGWSARLIATAASVGPCTQAAIPGLYAWGVSVAPSAWGPSAPGVAKVTAVLGVVSLLVGSVMERRRATAARVVSVWGLVIFSGLTWAIASEALSPTRIDVARGMAAAIGWGLFALASAAPAIRNDPALGARLVASAPLRARSKLQGGDGAFLVGGALAAVLFQTIGWQPMSPERSVLVRLVAVASSLIAIFAATSLATARHTKRTPARTKIRTRRALPWLTLLLLVLVGGALLFAAR